MADSLLSLSFLSLSLSLLSLSQSLSTHPDIPPLLSFKSTLSDPSNSLATWHNSSSSPCTWNGVNCSLNRVHRLTLQNLNLSGPILPLTGLTHLRLLSLKQNRFTGPLPDLSGLTKLKLLFLSLNSFSGPIPVLPLNLYRVDLSFNFLSGSLPMSLNRLTHLLTLRLEMNRFTGSISDLKIPNLQDFNVSSNDLSGEIPHSLSSFPQSAFESNPTLCGAPLDQCRVVSTDPTRPGSITASPVSSNPSTPLSSVPSTSSGSPMKNNRKQMGKVAIVLIIVGDILVLFSVVLLILYCCFWKTRVGKSQKMQTLQVNNFSDGGENKMVYSSNVAQSGFERGKMVFFEGARRFELEDLLRASAEMLGKGGSGTAYKAVMEDGDDVAVKRMKDGGGGKREFEMQMEVIGRLRHENVVALNAYYVGRDEKLLVYDYMPNGSLFWLLHGNRGPGRTPLDWTTRLRIVSGAAKGLSFIHNAKLTHGNIKSTNVLLDTSDNARVSDFGLSMFSPSSSFSSKSNGYRAPESVDPRKITQRSDVYSFGVLLLEVLTGKCPTMGDNVGGVVDLPRWVQSVVREEWTAEVFDLELMRYKDIEEEMVGLLQIAMACTSIAPDQRPKMSHVAKMIEEIRGMDVSPPHDVTDSVSDSPSVSEDAQ